MWLLLVPYPLGDDFLVRQDSCFEDYVKSDFYRNSKFVDVVMLTLWRYLFRKV